jgi:glucokinase
MKQFPESLIIGVDLGGSKLMVGLVAEDGTVIETLRHPSGGLASDPTEVVRQIATSVGHLKRLTPQTPISCIGVGSAGQIDPSTGTILVSPNLGWKNFPLRKELEVVLGISVSVLNDVQAITWAEWHLGEGQGYSDFLCVFVGTGVGGGIVSNGELVFGSRGTCGELGHTVLNHMGPLCRCGNFGCLEAYVGGWAIAQRVRQAVITHPAAAETLIDLAGGDLESLDAAILAMAADSHDSLANRLVAEIGNDLGLGISSTATLLDPQIVILGGGVIEGIPSLIGIVENVVNSRIILSSTNFIRVITPKLGSFAGVIGAALWAKYRLVPAQS